mmetsp:Transcript_41254/g.104006  ORF Transcript_41254/g.104006 Transcript_41254/m.104006 type:complete len:314 (+) Transcript_41254:1783-2724(+)
MRWDSSASPGSSITASKRRWRMGEHSVVVGTMSPDTIAPACTCFSVERMAPIQIICSCSFKYLSMENCSFTYDRNIMPRRCRSGFISFIRSTSERPPGFRGAKSSRVRRGISVRPAATPSSSPSMHSTSSCARASRYGLRGGQQRPNCTPVFKLVTTSREPPTSVHTTGRPARPASPSASGRPSDFDEFRNSHPRGRQKGAGPGPSRETLAARPPLLIMALQSAVYSRSFVVSPQISSLKSASPKSRTMMPADRMAFLTSFRSYTCDSITTVGCASSFVRSTKKRSVSMPFTTGDMRRHIWRVRVDLGVVPPR